MADVSTTQFAAREAAIAQAEADLKAKADALAQEVAAFAEQDKTLKARAAAIAQAEAEQRRKEAAEFAEAQAAAGKILPRQQAGLTELLLSLQAAPLEFADGDGTTAKIEPRAWLERFVAELPAQVDYTERAAGNSSEDRPAQFAAPSGYSVDARQLTLHQKASALAKHKKIPYADAIRELS